MIKSKGNLSIGQKWILIMFFLVPIAIIFFKLSINLQSSQLYDYLSLKNFPPGMQDRFRYLLFLPSGAVIVVLFRLTLGVRLMGPFRSILLAVAFQVTGIINGMIFLFMVIGVIVSIRPFLRSIRLPYFGRVSVILSVVASVMVFLLLFSSILGFESLHRIAYLPVVVLTLMGDAFARILEKEGMYSAMWRCIMTIVAAVLITMVSEVKAVRALFVSFPEFVFIQIGCIVLISEYLDLRLFAEINPIPVKKPLSKKSRKGSKKR